MIVMADLTVKLVTSMKSLVIEQVKDFLRKHLHQRLESDFGEALDIFTNEKGELLLYPDNLSITELAKAYQMLKAELQTLKSFNAEDVIEKQPFR